MNVESKKSFKLNDEHPLLVEDTLAQQVQILISMCVPQFHLNNPHNPCLIVCLHGWMKWIVLVCS